MNASGVRLLSAENGVECFGVFLAVNHALYVAEQQSDTKARPT
jgi:hypothetical protein